MQKLQKKELTRELLYDRHRLSDRQIDDWVGKGKNLGSHEDIVSQLSQVAYFIEITDYFREAGIPFNSFKGPLLSQKIYKDPTYRYFNDLDFLIDRQYLSDMLFILKERGFENEDFELPDNECSRKLWLDHTNQILLHNPVNNIVIEIHWSLFSVELISKNELKVLINSNMVSTHFHGREFKVFSHEFELIYLIIHGGSHHWGRLKWLLDIKELVNRVSLNEENFWQLAKKMRANQLVALCNSLLEIYFPGSKQLTATGKTSEKMLEKALYAIEAKEMFEMKTIGEYARFYWNFSKLVPGFHYKISVVKKMLFASDLAAKQWMPCSALLNYIFGPFWKLSRGIRF